MEQENLNKLRQIMRAEQEAYRAWLLEMPPEEILKHTWEYTAREDILMALYGWEPSKEKTAALLKSSSPLADVVKEYRDQDVDNEQIIAALEDAAKLNMEPPVYKNTLDYAVEHKELTAYWDSKRCYEQCVIALDKAIDDKQNCSHWDLKTVVQDMTRLFSVERITNLLANAATAQEWDFCYSHSNKEWARHIDTGIESSMRKRLVPLSHPAVIDSLISTFRREVLERGTGEKTAENPQQKPIERCDDLEL